MAARAGSAREASRSLVRRWAVLAVALVALAAFSGLRSGEGSDAAFVLGAPRLQLQSGRQASALRLCAEPEAVDASVVGEEEPEEEEEAPKANVVKRNKKEKVFGPEASADYAFNEDPPKAWFDRRQIDRHKVNTVLFDMYKKPKTFFPHDLKPGDTIRVTYLDAQYKNDEQKLYLTPLDKSMLQEKVIDGVLLNVRGAYQARTMTLRTMVGRGEDAMGYEFLFPMHSPLVTKIAVLRRGYIGKNKNAYFLRGMIGKRNTIPLDEGRTKLDKLYAELRQEDREGEIPEPEYPTNEWDRYPLPVWKQDMDDWDEEQYDPDKVDQRSDFEIRCIGRYKERVSRTGKYGWQGGR